MNDVILLLITALSGLFFSYLVVTLFNMGGEVDSSLGRDLQQIMMQIIDNVINVIFLPIIGVWNIVINVLTSMFGNIKWVVAFCLFTMCTFMMHYYHSEVLSIMDDSWKCFLIPLMNNIITPFLQITRVLYALTIPLINAFAVIHAQIFKAWYITFTTCSHVKMFNFFEEITYALIALTDSLAMWFGWGSGKKLNNNMFYNDFDIELPVNHTLTALSVSEEVLTCACSRFEDLYQTFFFMTREPHITAAINNFFQVGIRIFQLFFKTLFGEFPNIYNVMFKLERFILESGLAADSVFFNTLGNIIRMFDPDFELNRYPLEFIFTMVGQLLASAAHLFVTIFVNGPLHLMASFDINISAKDPKVWSLDHSFALLHKSAYSLSVIVQWFVFVIQQIVTGKGDLSTVFKNENAPLELICDWARDVDQNKYVNLPYTAGCVTYNIGIIGVNAGAIVYGAVVELLLKSVFTLKGQDVFRTLQRWEGPTIARKKVYTCEQRSAATAFDYTTAAHDSSGWIWTQDKAVCQCDKHYGTTLEEDVPQYNPWCGQASLNFDIFAPLDALIMHTSHGILGPGFGDAFPFIKPIREIGVNIQEIGLDATFTLPLTLPPITRTAVETARVMTRVVLSFGDIFTGHFFNYRVNCGHGLNHIQLIARWKSVFADKTLPDNKADLRWLPCESNEYKPTDVVGSINMMSRKNSNGESGKRTEICKDNNDGSDCMCSYMLPLSTDSSCQCIARYPDLDITASSQQVGDLIEDRFTSHNVSEHWCNSMIIEWTFQNTAAFADALDYIVSLGPINPTCDVLDRVIESEKGDTCADLRNEGRMKEADACELVSDTTKCDVLHNAGEVEAALACYTAATLVSGDYHTNYTLNTDSIKVGEADQRTLKSSGYLIATTPTLSFTGNFLNAERKMNHIEDLYTNRDQACGIMDKDGTKQWACDVSGTTSISTLDAAVSSTEEAGCTVWGRNDFFCSAGLYIRNTKRNSLNIARQVVNDGIAFLAGNLEDVNLQTRPRLCDYERQQGALASMVAGLIPNIGDSMRIIVAKYVNIVLQVYNVRNIRMVLTVLNTAITVVRNSMMEALDSSGSTSDVEAALKDAINTLVKGYIYDIIEFFKVTGDLLNEIKAGSGRICTQVADILTTVRDNISGGMIDLVAETVQMVLLMFAALMKDEDALEGFIDSFFSVVRKVLVLLADQLWVVLDEIYKFFGPIGDFFSVLTSSVCTTLNSVMLMISEGLSVFGVKIGWIKMTCVKPQSESSTGVGGLTGDPRCDMLTDNGQVEAGIACHLAFEAKNRLSRSHTGNHTAGRLGKHFLRSSDDNILPKKVAETLDWNGTSVCDHFMQAAADYAYTELRPLEKAKWFECLEQKLIGVELAKLVNSKSFPTDIVYNWKRKYVLLYDFVRVIKIVLPHFFDRPVNWANIRMTMYDAGIDAELYMRFFQGSVTTFHALISKIEASGMISLVMEQLDENYDNPANPSSTAKTWRSLQKLQSSYTYAHKEWTQKDMSQNMWKAIDASYDSHKHLVMWWNTIGHETKATETHTERVIKNLKRNWKKGTSILKTPHHHSRPTWLGVPIKTGIKRCNARGSPAPTWCTDCAILDNFLETTQIQGQAIAAFYHNHFPDIIREVGVFFNGLGDNNFFEKRFNKLSSSRPLPTVKNTDTRWLYIVKNDWIYLATNFTTYITNTSHKEKWLGQIDRFLSSSRKFFTYTNDTYVPFFGYSLYHMYDYLLFSSCNLEESIFVTSGDISIKTDDICQQLAGVEAIAACRVATMSFTSQNKDSKRQARQEARLNRMDNALLTCLIIAVVIATNTSWSVIPLVWLANTVVIGYITTFVYLYMVYGYMPSCAPLVPYTLVEDIFAWYNSRLQPGCFYKMLPYMAMTGNMTEDLCRTCSAPDAWTQDKIEANARYAAYNASTWNSTTKQSAFNGTYYEISLGTQQKYLNCAEYVGTVEGVLTLKEFMSEYGIFWNSLFWVRWTFPDVGKFAIKYGIVSFDSTLGKLALQAWQNAPIDNVWVDCYYAMWLNNILSIITAAVATWIVFKFAVIGVQMAIQVTILTWYIYTSISWMSLTVENSVVISE